MIFPALILAFVTLQRLGELVLARSNTARLLGRGGQEAGAGHYPLIMLLHATWLAGLWLLPLDQAPKLFWLTIFVVLQLLRIWVIATLTNTALEGMSGRYTRDLQGAVYADMG